MLGSRAAHSRASADAYESLWSKDLLSTVEQAGSASVRSPSASVFTPMPPPPPPARDSREAIAGDVVEQLSKELDVVRQAWREEGTDLRAKMVPRAFSSRFLVAAALTPFLFSLLPSPIRLAWPKQRLALRNAHSTRRAK